ncbi:regulator of chromosome condensation 1/beta-lactamase-inhibitor protein II [Aspergillus carlsbadensis]|nr:regulator of chromosome condensation 1/beta-lactamase-inhibitor protein II [Aspergillus carlsbadensis]
MPPRSSRKRKRQAPLASAGPPVKRGTVAPSQRLDVYVCGTNDSGELGMGDSVTEIVRPRLNPNLAAGTVGVVHLAVGVVHAAALTHDNQILTWGSNIDGTLGRDTTGDPDDDYEPNEDTDDDQPLCNLIAATPTQVDPAAFPQGTIFTQLAATQSATFVLTSTGSVYGWGTFIGSNGVVGFSPTAQQEPLPVLINGLDNVAKLVAGAQHMLALTSEGRIFSWGCNEQGQLGRQRSHYISPHDLEPAPCAVPAKVVEIGSGHYHSFAIHKSGDIYAWGLNDHGQTTMAQRARVEHEVFPKKLQMLKRKGDDPRDDPRIISIQVGKHHSHAIDKNGYCHSWGRIDKHGIGVDKQRLALSVNDIAIIRDQHGRGLVLKVPVQAEVIFGAISLGVGTDHSIAITATGEGYSWGMNDAHQAGQPGESNVYLPAQMRSVSINGKTLVFAGGGDDDQEDQDDQDYQEDRDYTQSPRRSRRLMSMRQRNP